MVRMPTQPLSTGLGGSIRGWSRSALAWQVRRWEQERPRIRNMTVSRLPEGLKARTQVGSGQAAGAEQGLREVACGALRGR